MSNPKPRHAFRRWSSDACLCLQYLLRKNAAPIVQSQSDMSNDIDEAKSKGKTFQVGQRTCLNGRHHSLMALISGTNRRKMVPHEIVAICLLTLEVCADTSFSTLQYTPNSGLNGLRFGERRRAPVGNDYGRTSRFVPITVSNGSLPPVSTSRPHNVTGYPASSAPVKIVSSTTPESTTPTTEEAPVTSTMPNIVVDNISESRYRSRSFFDAMKHHDEVPRNLDDAILAQHGASAFSFGPDLFRNFLNFKQPASGSFGSAISRFGAPYFVPVPIVLPPPPPPPPGPKCYTNPSGYLCCNATLERVITEAYQSFKKNPRYSFCNVQKMASVIQEAAEKAFETSFETLAAHKDFVAKSRFSGDLNCKVEIDGKYFLAYATPMPVVEGGDITIIDANNLFGGGGTGLDASESDKIKSQLLQTPFNGNGTAPADGQRFAVSGGTGNGKPTYLIYGPIR
uniref:Ground-like domain-containing protein n=1 Tax=Panagrellus redivivus TaxID=6233 RepID=A0A7E4VYK9_PANRE